MGAKLEKFYNGFAKSIPLITAFLAIFGSVLLWYLNQESARIQENYARKEVKYERLIESLNGFYTKSNNIESRNDFLEQLNLCWMYCPDDVILKAYTFLNMVKTDRKRDYSNTEKEKALGEFVLEMRKDLLSNEPVEATNLKAEQFQILIGNSIGN